MAKQPLSWENRGREIATAAADKAIAELEAEIQGKRERLSQVEEELRQPPIAQNLTEQSQLQREIKKLEEQLAFARDSVKPGMVWAAGRAGKQKDPSKSCFG